MTYVPIVIGSLAWGTPVNNAFTSQDARIADIERQGSATVDAYGFLAMTYDPAVAPAGTALTSGTVQMSRLDLPAPATISTITTAAVTAGTTLTAGQNFAGLYDAAGNRVAVTADQTVAWGTTGEKNMALTVPYAAAAGVYHVAYLSNGATPVSFLRGSSGAAVTALLNHGMSMTAARWALGPAAQTTLPATITMSARTLSPTSYFAAVS